MGICTLIGEICDRSHLTGNGGNLPETSRHSPRKRFPPTPPQSPLPDCRRFPRGYWLQRLSGHSRGVRKCPRPDDPIPDFGERKLKLYISERFQFRRAITKSAIQCNRIQEQAPFYTEPCSQLSFLTLPSGMMVLQNVALVKVAWLKFAPLTAQISIY